MFHSRKGGHDIKRANSRFMDPRKDTHTRFRALKTLTDQLPLAEIKALFQGFCVEIYYIFYEEFNALASASKSKGHKSFKEELEGLLLILEKLLLLVPEKVYERWQFNSIGSILRRLLHHGNVLAVREIGVKLYLLWLQDLQENIDELGLLVYGSIIPGFPSPVDKIDRSKIYRPQNFIDSIYPCISGSGMVTTQQSQYTSYLDIDTEWCNSEAIAPLLPPQQGEKDSHPNELTSRFLDRVLDYMTKKMQDADWKDGKMRESGFYYLFQYFKRFYLPHIFPLWDPCDRLFIKTDEILQTNVIDNKSEDGSQVQMTCRWRVLCWFVAFTIRFRKQNRRSGDDRLSDASINDDSTSSETHSITSFDDRNTHFENLLVTADVVRSVLYSTKDNVLCLHEVFRQGFLMPVAWSDIICRVLNVYNEWFKSSERPVFMLENLASEEPVLVKSNLLLSDDRSPLLRTSSYKEAVVNCDKGFFPRIPIDFVRAGLQANVRLFVTNASHVFFSRPGPEDLQKQADVCRRVIKMYRNIVLELPLDQQTWRQLLVVLLRITEYTLKGRPPNPREKSLGGQLAPYIFQTLFVTWIRGSLQVNVPEDLWNEMLRIISSLTPWHEIISEWAGTVETLTRVLARTVYGIDLSDLPLERLTEQKRKKQRGRVAAISSNAVYPMRKSFTRGWSRYYKSDADSNQSGDVSDKEGSATNVRDFVSLLPRTTSLSLTTANKEEPSKQPLRLIQSETSFPTASELPDVVNYDQGNQGIRERKPTLLEVAEISSNVSSESARESSLLLATPIDGDSLDKSTLDKELQNTPAMFVEETQLGSAPLAVPETSTSSDSSADIDQSNEVALSQVDGRKRLMYNERSSETESLLSDVLESAGRIYTKHLQGKKSASNLSISSAESFESCTSFPYSDDMLKSDGSRSATPSIQSDRLSRDGLDPYFTQMESSRSTNSLLEGAQDVRMANNISQDNIMNEMDSQSSIDTKPPDIISDHPSISDPDLISFDSEVQMSSKPIGPDSQSLDSAAFALFEGDTVGSFKVPKGKAHELVAGLQSSGSFTSSSSTLVGDRSDSQQHVRFADDQGPESSELPDNVTSYESPETRQRQDTLVEENESEEMPEPSVIAGGKAEGWTPVSATVLWRRMVGILGNINKIKDEDIHANVLEHLIAIWKMLLTVRQNQGISLDNRSTPPQPKLIPPLLFCSTWCFEAMSLSRATDHKTGRMLAYKLLCMMTVRRHDKDLSSEHLTHFYRLLHIGLTGSDQDVTNAIVSECSEFYSYSFPGSTALIFDFIFASNSIISTQNSKHPRVKAVTLLGSLISLPHLYSEMKLYQPGRKIGDADIPFRGKNLRENIIIPLLKAAKADPSCHARCTSLNSLGIFIIESLINSDGHPRLVECLAVILTSLCFHNKVVANVALDIIWSLVFYQEELRNFETMLPLKLVESLCSITLQLLLDMKQGSSDSSNDSNPEFISRVVLCLLDWAMVIPKDQLLSKRRDPFDCTTYLALIFKTFKKAHDGYPAPKYNESRRSLNVNLIIAGDSRPVRLSRVQDDVTVPSESHDTDDSGETAHSLTQPLIIEKKRVLIKKTAIYALSQLTNYLGHFPFNTGAVRPHSQVTENEDGSSLEDDLTPAIFDKDNVQVFLLNKTTLLSAVEITVEKEDKINSWLQTYDKYCRFILRDITGKYCWDQSILFPGSASQDETDMGSSIINWLRGSFRSKAVDRGNKVVDSSSTRLLAWDESSHIDRIDRMLQYIGNTSPECLIFPDQALNLPAPVPEQITTDIQSSVVKSVLKQHNKEQNYTHEIRDDVRINAVATRAPEVINSTAPFHMSRYFIHQLGNFSWEKRQEIDLLKPTPGLIRELKNLDNRPCRETHKIAIFYIGPGQEDKMSIMSNTAGSKMFEEFVSGMAWEVDLATHSGFIGGLERNLSTGNSAPYFATHNLEIIFHVSTRMPLSEGESSIITKVRHLGNDEVHIVWSEHSRDFRRGIINMEFGDVIIIIYPLPNGLFKIKIDRKPDVPPFGPLFDGAIVDGKMLPYLVRSTAVNGGRAKRSTMPLYERNYEERGRYIDQILQRHVERTTFEEFAENVFNPSRSSKNSSLDIEDGLSHRTFSVPSRPVTSSDPSAMMRLLDTHTDMRSQRNRASSAVDKAKERSITSPVSSTDDSAQELDIEKPRERKRSLSKRFKSGTRTSSNIYQDDSSTT